MSTRTGTRQAARRLAAVVAVLAAGPTLGGCQSDDGGSALDPSEAVPTRQAEPRLLTLVSQSAVGGEVSPLAQPLDSQVAIEEFASGFRDGLMLGPLTSTLDVVDVPDGQVAAGAVVAIGCEPPTEVDIEVTDAGVEVTAEPVKSDRQCLAPVTTVALIAADPDQL